MTGPRIPLFKRKGPPAGPKPGVTIAISHSPGSDDGAGPGVTAGPDDAAPTDVTCPKCGTEFDPATGEIKAGDQADGGGDALAHLFGGSSPAGA